MSEAVIFGLLAMLGFGLGAPIAKAPAQRLGPHKFIFLRSLLVVPLLFAYAFLLSKQELTVGSVALAFVIGLFGYLPLASFINALKHGKIGVVAPIAGSSVAITSLLAVIFFNERLTQSSLVAICLIVLGNILISINFKDWRSSDIFRFKSGVPNALLTMIGWGIVFFLFKFAVDAVGPYMSAAITETGNLIGSAIFLTAARANLKADKQSTINLVWSGLFVILAIASYNLGIHKGAVSVVAPLALSNSLVATIYSGIVQRERLQPIQYLAILVIISGIVLIAGA